MNTKAKTILAAAMLMCSVVMIAVGIFGDFGRFENSSILATLSPTQANFKANAKTVEKPTAEETQAVDEVNAVYILNTGSKTFHHPWCSFSDKIEEENFETVSGTRSEMLRNGYKPCGKCKP